MSFFKPGENNLITDVKGLYVGNSENELINTGTTILTCEDRFKTVRALGLYRKGCSIIENEPRKWLRFKTVLYGSNVPTASL